MLSLLTVLAMHIPKDMYLNCEDYQWLKEGVQSSTLFTPAEKTNLILKWIDHTDPHCFDD